MGYTLEVYPTFCLSAFCFCRHSDSSSTGADEGFAQWFASAQPERPAQDPYLSEASTDYDAGASTDDDADTICVVSDASVEVLSSEDEVHEQAPEVAWAPDDGAVQQLLRPWKVDLSTDLQRFQQLCRAFCTGTIAARVMRLATHGPQGSDWKPKLKVVRASVHLS